MVEWHHRLNRHEAEQTPREQDREPGMLRSMGSQRVRHDQVTKQQERNSLAAQQLGLHASTQGTWAPSLVRELRSHKPCGVAKYISISIYLYTDIGIYMIDIDIYLYMQMGFPGGSDDRESACNIGDWGPISGLGRSSGEGNGNHSSITAWRIPWTEEPDRLQYTGSQRVEHD